jgi:hypothetical protein
MSLDDVIPITLAIAIPLWWIIFPKSVLRFYAWMNPERSFPKLLYNEQAIRIMGSIVLSVLIIGSILARRH